MESEAQGSLWALQEPPVCKHLDPKMKNLTKVDKVVIEDCYHMTTLNEVMNWMKLTHLLLVFPLKLVGGGGAFVHLPLLSSSK